MKLLELLHKVRVTLLLRVETEVVENLQLRIGTLGVRHPDLVGHVRDLKSALVPSMGPEHTSPPPPLPAKKILKSFTTFPALEFSTPFFFFSAAAKRFPKCAASRFLQASYQTTPTRRSFGAVLVGRSIEEELSSAASQRRRLNL